jgi:hypothetical protein
MSRQGRDPSAAEYIYLPSIPKSINRTQNSGISIYIFNSFWIRALRWNGGLIRTDAGVQLEEQGQRLANSTSGAEDGDLGEL